MKESNIVANNCRMRLKSFKTEQELSVSENIVRGEKPCGFGGNAAWIMELSAFLIYFLEVAVESHNQVP